LIGIFAIPPLYVLFQGLRERIKERFGSKARTGVPASAAIGGVSNQAKLDVGDL
jgi:hypothetical protein